MGRSAERYWRRMARVPGRSPRPRQTPARRPTMRTPPPTPAPPPTPTPTSTSTPPTMPDLRDQVLADFATLRVPLRAEHLDTLLDRGAREALTHFAFLHLLLSH